MLIVWIRLPLKLSINAIFCISIFFWSFAHRAFADEIWKCVTDLGGSHSLEKNIFISQNQLWFADATVTFSILENNKDHVIANNIQVLKGKSHNDKTVARSIIILERSIGRITEIDETNFFRLADEDNAPVITGHWDCTKRP